MRVCDFGVVFAVCAFASVQATLRCDVCNPDNPDQLCDGPRDFGEAEGCPRYVKSCMCEIKTTKDKFTGKEVSTYSRRCGPSGEVEETCNRSAKVVNGGEETWSQNCTCKSDRCRACEMVTEAGKEPLSCYVCLHDRGCKLQKCKLGDTSCITKKNIGSGNDGESTLYVRRGCSLNVVTGKACNHTVKRGDHGQTNFTDCYCDSDGCNDPNGGSMIASNPAIFIMLNIAVGIIFKH